MTARTRELEETPAIGPGYDHAAINVLFTPIEYVLTRLIPITHTGSYLCT